MTYLSRCAVRLSLGLFAAGMVFGLAPLGQAQSAVSAAVDASAAATSSASGGAAKSTQQQIDDLQTQLATLQQQIASLKAAQDAPPAMQQASFVQTPAAAPAAAPADAKVNLAGLLGPTTISGFVDAYYGYNYNHPATNLSGLRFFDAPTNAFGLNMVEMIVDKAPDATSTDSRLGYHVSAGYGNAAVIVNESDTSATDFANFYVKEAYGEYLAPIGKGLTITVGKFVTPAGNEVIETNGNWNYSRGILFYYAIPFFHYGVNAKYAWNSKVAATFYLVNGWNNTIISHEETSPINGNGTIGQSSGLTYATSLAYTPNAKWSATENFFAGPVIDGFQESGGTVNNWKYLSDTVIGYTPNAKWSFALNGDDGFKTGTKPKDTWWGVAGYGKYTMSPKSYFAMRYEYYDDPQGYTLFGDFGHGFAQEATGTYSYNLTSGLQVRGEYRYDFASHPIFLKGPDHDVKEQNTATLGFIYSFSSANAK